MRTARKRFCGNCGTRQDGENQDTPTQLRLVKWVPVVFLLPVIAWSIGAISICMVYRLGYSLDDSMGYGTYRVRWVLILSLVPLVIWAAFRTREHRRNPFRCVVCNSSLE